MKANKVAVLNLYDQIGHQEVKQLRELASAHAAPAVVQTFEVRLKSEVPDLDHDIYLVSGGPGDPRDHSSAWTTVFYAWLERVWRWNQSNSDKKQVFLICHSFQMACLHFGIAAVKSRKSPAFGVYPVHLTDVGVGDALFEGIENPFFAADFRSFQVIEPRTKQMEKLGMKILALEKIRLHVPLDRAVMGIRFSDTIVGVQFHPEVSPSQMRNYLKDPVRKEQIMEQKGEASYQKTLRYLNDTTKMHSTYQIVLPSFLERAVTSRRALLIE